jgi:hypothetical protein
MTIIISSKQYGSRRGCVGKNQLYCPFNVRRPRAMNQERGSRACSYSIQAQDCTSFCEVFAPLTITIWLTQIVLLTRSIMVPLFHLAATPSNDCGTVVSSLTNRV